MPPQALKIDSPSPQVAHHDAEKYFQWLTPAFDHSRFDYSLDEFSADLIDGIICLVRVFNDDEPTALAACRVQVTNDGNELLVMAITGEGAGVWLDPLNSALETLAIEAGCSHICLKGRPGWSRWMKPRGYKLHQVTMRKDLRGSGNGQSRQI